jgi:hypothetical protein
MLAGEAVNIRFIAGSSCDLDPALGHFHLVVMGRSFHWMDRVDTLERLDRLIERQAQCVREEVVETAALVAWRSNP